MWKPRTYVCIGSSSFLSADKEGWGQVTGQMRPPRLATYVNLLTSVQRLLNKIYEVWKRLSHEMDLAFDDMYG